MEWYNNEAFHQNQRSFPVIREWSEEFNCYRINGILAPIPISMVRENEVHQAEPSQSGCAASSSSSKKKRTKEGDEELFFRLFKFLGAGHNEEYVLEMNEPKTYGVDRYRVLVHETNGIWKISTSDLEDGGHLVLPVVEDPSPPKFPPKYTLSMPERLVGWTVERRKRSNGKEDKFYYHGGRQFRSFVEVTAFILYSSKPKDLKSMTPTAAQPQQDLPPRQQQPQQDLPPQQQQQQPQPQQTIVSSFLLEYYK